MKECPLGGGTDGIAAIIDKAAREAGVDPKDPVFRAKLFKALWAAGVITPGSLEGPRA